MPDWTPPPLPESAASIDATLKDLATIGDATLDAIVSLDDELSLLRRTAFPVKPVIVETGEPGYPWAPGTQAQGFLGSRWNRRDGNVYATPAPLTGGCDIAQSQSHPSRAGRR